MFILDNHVAVVVKYTKTLTGFAGNCTAGETRKLIVPMNQFRILQISKDLVILEAWDITSGKCISN